MTWLDDVGIRIPQRSKIIVTNNMLDTSKLAVVIPVKDNQAGINKLLASILKLNQYRRPAKVVIVDNNSLVPLNIDSTLGDAAKERNLSIILLKCFKPGPAAARNVGWRYAIDMGAEWILFVDSDCVFTPTTILSYISAMDGSIAYQGSVSALGADWLSSWYIKEQILIPKVFRDPHDSKLRPNYIITANVLIHKIGLLETGGFNEDFKLAAGEDVWLGYMLSDLGTLAFAPDAIIQHDFLDGAVTVKIKNMCDLINRFERYGHGNHSIDMLLKVDKVDDCTDRMQLDDYLTWREFFMTANQDAACMQIVDSELLGLIKAALTRGYETAKENYLCQHESESKSYKPQLPLLFGYMADIDREAERNWENMLSKARYDLRALQTSGRNQTYLSEMQVHVDPAQIERARRAVVVAEHDPFAKTRLQEATAKLGFAVGNLYRTKSNLKTAESNRDMSLDILTNLKESLENAKHRAEEQLKMAFGRENYQINLAKLEVDRVNRLIMDFIPKEEEHFRWAEIAVVKAKEALSLAERAKHEAVVLERYETERLAKLEEDVDRVLTVRLW